MKSVLSLVIFLLLNHGWLAGQPYFVEGKVQDMNGRPLAGANILLKSTSNGVASDSEGKFVMEVTAEQGVLIFAFIGYKMVEKKMEFPMSESSSMLVTLVKDKRKYKNKKSSAEVVPKL
jgi:hypothetical protein